MCTMLLRRSLLFVILFALCLLILQHTFRPLTSYAQSVPVAGTVPPLITPTWTTWGAEQYAVADDGDDFWIGASGGIVRWHKPSQTYQRYSGVDGLPHRHVYAVAVDGAGNRWFGGDGGLSRLDTNEVWTHFTPANSGLQRLLVDGIAVGADNTIWVSHGLPDGRVSRRDPDGSWTWFPNRSAAVTSDYARIVQSQNQNPLWAVANGEVWVGFLVYDGTQWLDRTPSDVTAAPKQITTAAGKVWAFGGGWRA